MLQFFFFDFNKTLKKEILGGKNTITIKTIGDDLLFCQINFLYYFFFFFKFIITFQFPNDFR